MSGSAVAVAVSPAPTLDIARYGQVFTPPGIVDRMLALRRNHGRVLDPASGDGAFSGRIPGCVAIELDAAHCPAGALNIDFFAYPESEQFATVIGNPPYVKARDILPETALRLGSSLLDGHANLYLHFIEKCVRHLAPGGELILITPRDFLKATGAGQLNTWLCDQGTITDFEDLGDAKIFAGAAPNCAIWRFEKGNASHRLRDGRRMALSGGQLMFTRGIYSLPLASVFAVKVGAGSGADSSTGGGGGPGGGAGGSSNGSAGFDSAATGDASGHASGTRGGGSGAVDGESSTDRDGGCGVATAAGAPRAAGRGGGRRGGGSSIDRFSRSSRDARWNSRVARPSARKKRGSRSGPMNSRARTAITTSSQKPSPNISAVLFFFPDPGPSSPPASSASPG